MIVLSAYHRVPEVEMTPPERQPEIKDFLFISNRTVQELSEDLVEVNMTEQAEALNDIADEIAFTLEEEVTKEIDTYPMYKLRAMLLAQGKTVSNSADDLVSHFQYREGGV